MFFVSSRATASGLGPSVKFISQFEWTVFESSVQWLVILVRGRLSLVFRFGDEINHKSSEHHQHHPQEVDDHTLRRQFGVGQIFGSSEDINRNVVFNMTAG